MKLDDTHDPALQCWVDSAAGDTDFPIQNLPLGRYQGLDGVPRTGVAIGAHILDLRRALDLDLMSRDALAAAHLALNDPMALNACERLALRRALSAMLSVAGERARRHADELLCPQADVHMLLPTPVKGFTDFQAGIHHTLNGRRMRGDDSGTLPAVYHKVPVAYNGRASSVVVSGTPIRRPRGQIKGPHGVLYQTTKQLDIELELGIWVSQGNMLSQPIDVDDADKHIGAFCLINDWSARDIMAWEMDRLGPFTGKSFATTVSPWLISPEALAPFRGPAYERSPDPTHQPPPHLSSARQQQHGGLHIGLQVWVNTSLRESGQEPLVLVAESHTRHLYWTPAQMLAHQTSSGCNLVCGDLVGTGTISGPARCEAGSLKELGLSGTQPFFVGQESRCWAEDGDLVVLRAKAQRDGFRSLGFGECAGRVVPGLGEFNG